jgi:hypothetical protein
MHKPDSDAEYDVQSECSCTECGQLISDDDQEWLHGGTASVWWPAAELGERFKRTALEVRTPVGAAWPECSNTPILCQDAIAHALRSRVTSSRTSAESHEKMDSAGLPSIM